MWDHKRRLLLRSGVGLSLYATARLAQAVSVAESSSRFGQPASMTSRASRSLLTRVARAGSRLVAVGERGIVVLSDDGGLRWRQVALPVNVTLTAVTFADSKNGWIAGHSGVLLHSTDGGETWSLQYDGQSYARTALQQAKDLVGLSDQARDVALRDAQRIVDDGPDKPFLALCFADARHGLAVGAYGIAASTSDGGKSWQPCAHRIPNARGMHLYAVATFQGRWVVAGEQGILVRSTDGGRSFAAINAPHKRSFFSAVITSQGHVVLGGLLGNVCVLDPATGELTESRLPGSTTVIAGTMQQSGRLLLTDQGGRLLQSDDGGLTFTERAVLRLPLTSLTETAEGGFVATSFVGAIKLSKDLALNKALQ